MQVFTRRQAVLLSLSTPLLSLATGCVSSSARSVPNSSSDAASLLLESASAHGLHAYAAMRDLNVSYSGHWRWLVGKLQPVLVDSGFRGGSQERLLLHTGVIAQSHTGPQGHKQVVRITDANEGPSVHVWYNGEETKDRDRTDAAALVADAYSLFLLGPMLLVENENPHRDIQASMAGTAEVKQDKGTYACDLINLSVRPGFGNSETDQLVLFVERATRLMRRVRMTINGLESTRGALVEIDTYEHRQMHGVFWPTSFHERLLHPAPLDVHSWRLTGLDVDRGESRAELSGPTFTGKASSPAVSIG